MPFIIISISFTLIYNKAFACKDTKNFIAQAIAGQKPPSTQLTLHHKAGGTMP
jgi:hypothetical protein